MNYNIDSIGTKCFGCGLCKNICPFEAIEFIEDKEGFLYPSIEKEKCKNCGKCLKECPTKEISFPNMKFTTKAYMAISKDQRIYNNSASGGFATVLSKYVIEKLGGAVYGCAMDEEANVKHIKIGKIEDLVKIQDSKYVQSNIIDIFNEIKDDLKMQRILFIGTPCQVDAIKKFCGNELCENLITCDLVCHGVPSPGVFKKYYNFLLEKNDYKLKQYRFRNKSSYDKCGYRGRLIIGDRRKYFFTNDDMFYDEFLNEKNYRISCYDCKYKNTKRTGDFTLGDVNSWELYYDFYPELASSLVILNNQKAKDMFALVNSEIEFREISLPKEVKINKALSQQALYPLERSNIYNKYNDLYNNKKKSYANTRIRLKNIFKLIVPFKYRILLKKYIHKNMRKSNINC